MIMIVLRLLKISKALFFIYIAISINHEYNVIQVMNLLTTFINCTQFYVTISRL